MLSVYEALGLLRPYEVDKPKARFGPATDGGYVLIDDLDPSQAILSYGISTQYEFDAERAALGHKVYMFDHTIEGVERTHDNMLWFKEGVAGVTDEAALVYTIEDHLERHRIEGDRLILKMDVEGHEFDAMLALGPEVLARFEQLTFEVHCLMFVEDANFRATQFTPFFQRLNDQFTLHHVHANNFDGVDLRVVDGLPIPCHLELSYVRTSTVTRRPSETLYPTPLDYPNVGYPDKALWFYPFLPAKLTPEDFARSWACVTGEGR